jgi:hypothetical protein
MKKLPCDVAAVYTRARCAEDGITAEAEYLCIYCPREGDAAGKWFERFESVVAWLQEHAPARLFVRTAGPASDIHCDVLRDQLVAMANRDPAAPMH